MTSHITSTTSRRSRLHLVAAVAASVLLLTGCNSGGDPGGTTSASPTSTASPSATPTPTPTPAYVPASASGRAQNVPMPVLPEVAKTETKEGLEAFVRYWFQLLSYGYETGDTKPLEGISRPNCVFCTGLRDGLAAAWSDGRWVAGGTIQTPSIDANLNPGSPSQATVQVIQAQIEIRMSDGGLYQDPTKATNRASLATATFGDSGWVLTDLSLIR
ncbi:DUF6318 family protein [Arthrobacter sp. 4R501]|uniref:DUF6318 family protein n=1 Tax=Arthrobacter sp. 4R501 TaxID=2058886 RepID=UPI000CE439CC|nr:DUF6318 family protein [Arthrobacter sp. 4R501]